MDELQKALKESEKKIVSRGYGDGTGERGWFSLNKDTHTLEPYCPGKKNVAAPFVITDEIEPVMSMTGSDKIYSSKSALRREYKEMGFVEVGPGGNRGNYKPPTKEERMKEIRETVAKSLNDLKYGNVPISEREREINLREEREWQAYKKGR
jgi:hypothetical protein